MSSLRCPECNARLLHSDPDNIGMCTFCGAYAPKRRSAAEARTAGARLGWQIRRLKQEREKNRR